MRAFRWQAPGDLRFGRGEAEAAVPAIAGLGKRVLVVHGSTAARAQWLLDQLDAAGCERACIQCGGEPDLDRLEDALSVARAFSPECVVGIGGGSVIDLAKAIAALAPATTAPLDHLEVVGRGQPLLVDPLPFAALPTTAGTGSEVTKNAVIGVPDSQRKVSLRDPRMIADLAVVDPGLTDGAPRSVTLASGLDAITQVIEPYLCSRANAMSDAVCKAAIPVGLHALVRLMDTEDAQARDGLAWTSLAGGLALANSGLGAVHGLAGVLGGHTGAAHGALCGTMLPHVFLANRERTEPGSPEMARFDWVAAQIGDALGVDAGSAAGELAAWSKRHGLPGLIDLGAAESQFSEVAEASRLSSSMKANPVELTASDLEAILRSAA